MVRRSDAGRPPWAAPPRLRPEEAPESEPGTSLGPVPFRDRTETRWKGHTARAQDGRLVTRSTWRPVALQPSGAGRTRERKPWSAEAFKPRAAGALVLRSGSQSPWLLRRKGPEGGGSPHGAAAAGPAAPERLPGRPGRGHSSGAFSKCCPWALGWGFFILFIINLHIYSGITAACMLSV